jgi:Cu-Zn family superoxide dismutase
VAQPDFDYEQPRKPAFAAICDFTSGAGKVEGRLTLTQGAGYDDAVRITGYISPLKPGKHGFHIHMYGDFSDGCTSAGGHYNPLKSDHGSPQDEKNLRHVGDLGNIKADYDGVARIDVTDALVSLDDSGKFPIGGRSIVVHEDPDDLGRGGDEGSRTTGNAGGRAGCCLIVRVDPAKVAKH